jgi:hypothetical protein
MKKALVTAGVFALMSVSLVACSGTSTPAPTVTVTSTPTPTETKKVELEPAAPVTPVPSDDTTDTKQRANPRAGTGAMTDTEFGDFVHKARPILADVPSASLVDLADSACNAFDRGATFGQVVSAITKSASTTEMANALGFTIGAGVRIYCPEHVEKLKQAQE